MKRLLTALLLVIAFVVTASAQTTNGKLVGTVAGPDGLIVGATVTVIDDQTKRELTAVTGGSGSFIFPQLSFGTYTLTVSATGFKTTTATDLKIDANVEYSREVILEVGAPTETVTVIAGADVINNTNGELKNTVSPRQVLELPLNGRNPLALLNTVAGANATSNSINGQRSSSVNYTRDGINVQDNFIRNGFVSDQPSVDDTGEFTVTTQNAGAELGGGGSTQVQLVTPRGGRQYTGALFEYNRNSKFASNNFFNNLGGTKLPFLNRNQFGGRVSGMLPVLGFGEGTPLIVKNKAFFFVSYERFILSQQAIANRTTLLAPARNGTFTYTATDGSTQTVNVLTGNNLNLAGANQTVFTNAGGVLAVDPIIQSRILNNTPTVGNLPTFTGTNFLQSLSYNISDGDRRNRYTTRIDYDVNDKNNFNFVYSFNKNQDERPDVEALGYTSKPFVSQGGPTRFFTGAYNFVLGSNFTNEVRGGYQRSEPFFNQGPVDSNYIISIPLFSNPEPAFRSQGRNTDYANFQDNASYSIGNHSLKFGGQYQSYKIVSSNLAGAGLTTYTISTTGNANTPPLSSGLFPAGINSTDLARANSLRYLLGGIVGSASTTANLVNQTSGYVLGAPSIRTLRFANSSAYVQDQWRVTNALTVNLGLRYEYFSPLRNPQGIYLEPVIANLESPLASLLNPNGTYNFVGTNSGKPGEFFKPDRNNLGPTFSFAYSFGYGEGILGKFLPKDKTVIRGGFRTGFINDEYVRSSDSAAGQNQGAGSLTSSLINQNARFSNLPSLSAVPTFVVPPRTYAQNNTAAQFGNFGTVFAINPNLQLQQNFEYNIGIQREIANQTVLELRYVGGHSNNAVRGVDFNQVEIRNNGFLNDFLIAQNNCRLQGATINPTSTQTPLQRCTDARYNPAIVGSQITPVFNRLPNGGSLNSPGNIAFLQNGTAADLAINYVSTGNANNGTPNNFLLPNYNTGVIDYLTNGGKYRYNSFQAEIRRRFLNGFAFQGNYTFQKILSSIPTDGQARFDPYLDNSNTSLDYARPDYDRTHSININFNYELPFGKGKSFINNGGITNFLLGGFQVTSIINLSSGVPLSILDTRGVLNRAGRSTRQVANSSLSGDEIKKLTGIYKTPNGVFAIDPKVLFAVDAAGNRVDLTKPLAPGQRISSIRGANPYGTTPFAGQVFFPLEPGQVGNTQRTNINGPRYINWDASIIKNFSFSEKYRFQIRGEAFNVLNRVNYFISSTSGASTVFDVNNTNFGRINVAYAPRIIQLAARFEF